MPFSQFDPLDLEHATTFSGDALDALPFGVIVVDRRGTILEYNQYESSLSGLEHDVVVGRNFFHDVAPCTALKEFEGRFEAFLDSHDTSVEPFQFLFRFPGRTMNVSVIFVRTNFESERATICIVRRDEPAA